MEESQVSKYKTKSTLPQELFEWLSELRFIGKAPGCPSALQLTTPFLELQLVCYPESGNGLAVYRLPAENLNILVADLPEDSYSINPSEGNGQDIPPLRLLPLHEQCIELLQKLKTAYTLTDDETWRFLAEKTTQTLTPDHDHDHDPASEEYHFANPIYIPSLNTYIRSSLLLLLPSQSPLSPTPSLSSPVCYADYDAHNHKEHEREHLPIESKARIPFLWDLDEEACMAMSKDQSFQVRNWGADPGADAPMGLRNRVRIWEGARRRFVELGYDVG